MLHDVTHHSNHTLQCRWNVAIAMNVMVIMEINPRTAKKKIYIYIYFEHSKKKSTSFCNPSQQSQVECRQNAGGMQAMCVTNLKHSHRIKLNLELISKLIKLIHRLLIRFIVRLLGSYFLLKLPLILAKV